MLHNKAYYRKFKCNGYEWGGAYDYPESHFFVKELPGYKFLELKCTEDCLSNGNFEFMANHELTFTDEKLKEICGPSIYS